VLWKLALATVEINEKNVWINDYTAAGRGTTAFQHRHCKMGRTGQQDNKYSSIWQLDMCIQQ